MQSIVELKNLQYIRDSNQILQIQNWEIQKGEHWVLLGPNGSGKTSLIKILTAYEWPTSGIVTLFGNTLGNVPTLDFRKNVGIFEPYLQTDVASIPEDTTALEILCTGYDGSLRAYHEYTDNQINNARTLINQHFQNEQISDRPYHLLSSGEKRRVLLLRTVINQPDFIVIDEPYEFLDIKARLEIELFFHNYLIENANRSSLTVLHRAEEIPVYASHAALLKRGILKYAGQIDSVIHSSNLSDIYDLDLDVRKHQSHFSCQPILKTVC